ncbi:MAG: GGDEF domain-containing protein [Terracidiphilus sp.]
MISIKKYLDSPWSNPVEDAGVQGRDLLAMTLKAYGAALEEMGNCSLDVCPGMGDSLKRNLSNMRMDLSADMSREALASTDKGIREQLREWGRGTAQHFQQKAREVKEMLLMMARTAESVSQRDEQSAAQMTEVTKRLKSIVSLEDLTQIRSSVEKCATDLKASVDRMREEGTAAVSQLRKQVAEYRSKLEAAEELAWRDGLTGLSSRAYVESQIQRRVEEGFPFCVALMDLNDFKAVNDRFGHQAGDELLLQFSSELRSARRTADVVGRWGGDEFIVLLDCDLAEATIQVERLRERVCGDYTVQFKSGAMKFRVDASVGLAGSQPGEGMKDLVARADSAMYMEKAAWRRRREMRAS